jgi:hypothetical protein
LKNAVHIHEIPQARRYLNYLPPPDRHSTTFFLPLTEVLICFFSTAAHQIPYRNDADYQIAFFRDNLPAVTREITLAVRPGERDETPVSLED